MHTPFPTRKNIRLTGYDYSEEGLYFITICTHQRKHLFGKIIDGKISLNDFGNIAYQRWLSNDLVIGKLWQRNYYEHIIRSDRELENIYLYIQCNPVNWLLDSLIAKID